MCDKLGYWNVREGSDASQVILPPGGSVWHFEHRNSVNLESS